MLAGSSARLPLPSVFVRQRAQNCPTITEIRMGQDKTLTIYVVVSNLRALYNPDAMNKCRKRIWPIGMKLELNLWHRLLHRCIYQTGHHHWGNLGHVIGIVFKWYDFSGMKRSCWTTGSWWCCLSLEVVSLIPAGSTIIYRFLCGCICVSLARASKLNQQQGKSEGFDCCDRPSNLAQIWSKSSIFQPVWP